MTEIKKAEDFHTIRGWLKPRLSVLGAFFINGFLIATWVARIPAIQEKLNLSKGTLGLVLLGMGIGVLVALSLAGSLIARFSSRTVTLAASLAMCFFLPLLALMPSAPTLWIALFLFGVAISTMDVAMNDQAVLVEKEAGTPLMSTFHASFSIGALAGALFGAGIAWLSVEPLMHFILVAFLLGILTLLSARYLLRVKSVPGPGGSPFRLPPRIVWPLGAIAFCAAIGEGAMADWSAVFLSQSLKTTAAMAALGFAAFSFTMTIGRLLGDRLAVSFGPESIVRIGGFLAGGGILAAIVTNEPIVVLIGFAAVGAGLANVIPLAFSAAGRLSQLPAGVGIAGVASIGYAGFLAGPPVIGLVAEGTSLRFALLIVAILCSTLIATARAIKVE
ncbi:MAG: MFS transporter [Candidatus Promineifilaceae bacterium]|nr:MFS transporter [Candidatus Promineifilaceae bacterium]